MELKQMIIMAGLTVEEMDTMFHNLLVEARAQREKEKVARRTAESLEKAAGALNKIRRACGD